MSGVDAFDIEARIGLGIAFLLRLAQHLAKVGTGPLHLGKDVIAGAVEDAVDAGQRIGRRAFAQPLEDGDAARHRRFEGEGCVVDGSGLGQLEPVMRDHRLVGGDNPLAVVEGSTRQGERRPIRSADQLHHDIDIVARGHGLHVVDPGIGRQVDAAVLAPFARSDRRDRNRASGARGNHVAIGLDKADNPDPDRAQSCQGDAQRFSHGWSPARGSQRPCAPHRAPASGDLPEGRRGP